MEPVTVLYKKVDGAHFFLSDEKEVGLCVAHKDLKTAYEAVSTELATLYKHNKHIDAEFVPALTYEAFSQWLLKSEQISSPPAPGLAGQTRWTTSSHSPEPIAA